MAESALAAQRCFTIYLNARHPSGKYPDASPAWTYLLNKKPELAISLLRIRQRKFDNEKEKTVTGAFTQFNVPSSAAAMLQRPAVHFLAHRWELGREDGYLDLAAPNMGKS